MFVGNEGSCKLYLNRAADRVSAHLFSLSSPVLGDMETSGKSKRRTECKFSYVASCKWARVKGYVFLEPTPYNTVTSPGDSIDSTTVTAYNYRDNSLYLEAGRGFAPDGMVTPHFAAPGVNVKAAFPGNQFGNASGTSLAAAQAAGIAALPF